MITCTVAHIGDRMRFTGIGNSTRYPSGVNSGQRTAEGVHLYLNPTRAVRKANPVYVECVTTLC